MHSTCYFKGVFDTTPKPLTEAEFDRIINDEKLKATCQEIEEILSDPNLSDEDKYKQAGEKKNEISYLFGFQAGEYTDGHRSKETAVLNGLVIIDGDHLPEDFDSFFEKRRDKIMQYHPLFIARTPRRGLRIVLPLPQGMSIADAQEYYYDLFDFPEQTRDTSIKDPSRLSFAVPRDYIYYVDREALWGDKHYEVKAPEGYTPASISSNKHTVTAKQKVVVCNVEKAVFGLHDDMEFDGVKYSVIFNELVKIIEGNKKLGASRHPGQRHQLVYLIACNFSKVCDNNPELLSSFFPDDFWGHDAEDSMRCIVDGCHTSQTAYLPKFIQQAIANAKALNEEENAGDEQKENRAPRMPRILPDPVFYTIRNVPLRCREYCTSQMFACFATYNNNIQVRMLDDDYCEVVFFALTVADSGAGKRYLGPIVKTVLEEIELSDAEALEQLKEWKKKERRRSKDTEGEEEPELPIICLPSDITKAGLNKALDLANGRFLHFHNSEFSSFVKGIGQGWTEKICKGFDCDSDGQSTATAGGVTAKVKVKMQINATTTPDNARKYLSSHISDGCVSRFDMSTIDKDDPRPVKVRGEYNDEYKAKIKTYIENIKACAGQKVECNEVLAKARKLQKKYERIQKENDDEFLRLMMYRAINIAIWKGYMLYIMQGQRWSKEIGDFMDWSVKYDIWCKYHFFGTIFEEKEKKDRIIPHRGPVSLLSLLSDEFSVEDLRKVRRMNGREDGLAQVKQQLANWQNRKYIQRISEGRFKKIA